VKDGCYTLTGNTNLDVLYISDTNPTINGNEKPTTNNETIWEPRPFVWNVLDHEEEHEIPFVRSYCNTGPGPHYIWVTGYTTFSRSTGAWLRFDDTMDWVANVPFSEISSYSFSQTLHHSVSLLVGDRKFDNYQEKAPFYSDYESGPLNLRALWPSQNPGYFSTPLGFLSFDSRFGFATYC